MALRIENDFTQYQLTEEEQLEAWQVSPLTKMYLQNLLATEVMKRVNLTIDPAMPVDFIQAEAYQKGKIEMLQQIKADFDFDPTEYQNPAN